MVSKDVEQAVERIVSRSDSAQIDVEYLLSFAPDSEEAAYVVRRAHELGFEACRGQGLVFAQIGVDENACPENCRFCSFAAMNVPAGDVAVSAEVSLEQIVHFARLFDEAGVHLISLMATAGLSFERYLQIVVAVHDALEHKTPIMANTADLTREQACALRESGAHAAYHAVRLQEGELTDIDPEVRRATMRNIREAGLALMTGVEPLWAQVPASLVSERVCELADFDPFAVGACSFTANKYAQMGQRTPASCEQVRYVGALTRLACMSAPIGGIGATVWVDAGTDPRKRGYADADDVLYEKVGAARNRLRNLGYAVSSRAPLYLYHGQGSVAGG